MVLVIVCCVSCILHFLEWHLPEGKLELLKLDHLTHFGFLGLENCAGGWQGMAVLWCWPCLLCQSCLPHLCSRWFFKKFDNSFLRLVWLLLRDLLLKEPVWAASWRSGLEARLRQKMFRELTGAVEIVSSFSICFVGDAVALKVWAAPGSREVAVEWQTTVNFLALHSLFYL